MLFEKMRLAKKPYTRKFSFRKKVKVWYVFPQRWTWRMSVADIRYKADGNIYEHNHFWLIYRYQFSWLFIDITWELDMSERLSTSEVRHEPIKYVTEGGEMFNH